MSNELTPETLREHALKLYERVTKTVAYVERMIGHADAWEADKARLAEAEDLVCLARENYVPMPQDHMRGLMEYDCREWHRRAAALVPKPEGGVK